MNFSGLPYYALEVMSLRIKCAVFYAHTVFNVLKITQNDQDNTISVRWRIVVYPVFKVRFNNMDRLKCLVPAALTLFYCLWSLEVATVLCPWPCILLSSKHFHRYLDSAYEFVSRILIVPCPLLVLACNFNHWSLNFNPGLSPSLYLGSWNQHCFVNIFNIYFLY